MKLKFKEDPKEWRKQALLTAPGLAILSSVLHWRHVLSAQVWLEPTNVLGMTKALMERLLIQANIGHSCPGSLTPTTFASVRYGNVLASRGSVIPLFLQQRAMGVPLTITSTEMTRFFMSISDAVDAVLHAVRTARPGEILVSPMQAAKVSSLVEALVGAGAPIKITVLGIKLKTWGLEKNAAAPPPEVPIADGTAVETLTLIPYGCTNLRITEFPTVVG